MNKTTKYSSFLMQDALPLLNWIGKVVEANRGATQHKNQKQHADTDEKHKKRTGFGVKENHNRNLQVSR